MQLVVREDVALIRMYWDDDAEFLRDEGINMEDCLIKNNSTNNDLVKGFQEKAKKLLDTIYRNTSYLNNTVYPSPFVVGALSDGLQIVVADDMHKALTFMALGVDSIHIVANILDTHIIDIQLRQARRIKPATLSCITVTKLGQFEPVLKIMSDATEVQILKLDDNYLMLCSSDIRVKHICSEFYITIRDVDTYYNAYLQEHAEVLVNNILVKDMLKWV